MGKAEHYRIPLASRSFATEWAAEDPLYPPTRKVAGSEDPAPI